MLAAEQIVYEKGVFAWIDANYWYSTVPADDCWRYRFDVSVLPSWLLLILSLLPDYVDHAVRHVMMRQGVLGVTVSIMLPHDPTVSVHVHLIYPPHDYISKLNSL